MAFRLGSGKYHLPAMKYGTRALRPLLLLFLISTYPLPAQRTLERDDYPNGAPKLLRQMLDSVLDGIWTEWYPDGTVRYRAEWKDGMGHGRWQYYYPDGTLRSDEVYDRDRPVGIARQYHHNGKLREESVYVAGRLHGLQRRFDVQGTPTTTERYREGERLIARPEDFAPGVISTDDNEWGLSFTSGGDTLYFTRRPVGEQRQRIYRSIRADTGWMMPTVAPFSTDTDESPFVSHDGRWLYFASFRAVPGRPLEADNDMNLWRVPRIDGGYGVAEPLAPSINRIRKQGEDWPLGYEAGPHLDAAGNLYYWSATASGAGSADVLRANPDGAGGFMLPVPLTAINTATAESAPALSPDGRYLFFASYGRADGYGMEDLYVAVKTNNGWSETVNLGPIINGDGNEGCPTFSPDGRYFYYCQDDGEGTPSGIRHLEMEFLPLPR